MKYVKSIANFCFLFVMSMACVCPMNGRKGSPVERQPIVAVQQEDEMPKSEREFWLEVFKNIAPIDRKVRKFISVLCEISNEMHTEGRTEW